MKTAMKPPPGQRYRNDFPRFGLPRYANRFPTETEALRLAITGDVESSTTLEEIEVRALPYIEQVSDFHCVTTWTHRDAMWGGYRFADLYRELVIPRARPDSDIELVVLRCQDGYRTSLPLADLMAPDVLLADSLAGERLSIAHGAPLRLVTPAHYAYKSPKHLKGIEFWRDERNYRSPGLKFMDHPRARVAFEERGRVAPGWLYRLLYRPLIGPTIRRFRRALDDR